MIAWSYPRGELSVKVTHSNEVDRLLYSKHDTRLRFYTLRFVGYFLSSLFLLNVVQWTVGTDPQFWRRASWFVSYVEKSVRDQDRETINCPIMSLHTHQWHPSNRTRENCC